MREVYSLPKAGTTRPPRGEVFVEARTVRKSRSAIFSVLDLRPATARLLGENGDREVGVEEVAVGALIVVRPGDRVPLDGRVISGTSGRAPRVLRSRR